MVVKPESHSNKSSLRSRTPKSYSLLVKMSQRSGNNMRNRILAQVIGARFSPLMKET